MTKRKAIGITIMKKLIASQNYNCKKCQNILPYTFQIDHIIPWSISKNNDIKNLQALCSNCHSIKTQKDNQIIREHKQNTKNTQNTKNKILKDILQKIQKIEKHLKI